ncbi:aminopeptidase N [Alsobacter metallidurans]|uniref:Aminopeptidase N n=1 Tax=Alsobacter metallidurans TaxID=340221 RepID=A0A917I5T9_9HYPH|nr:aminopeptidase N [Alsobacter metallidurans]GGH14048.1 aminopeptidase N [Alsobacter metallidurans]
MRTDAATPVRLEDYRPTDYLIDTVSLDVRLHATATVVRAELGIRPNPAGVAGAALRLDGDELELLSITLDGLPLAPTAYEISATGLTVLSPPQRPFRLTMETRINPTANTKLMGLYRSSGVYCTQCEAEGFRRITYFLDRPDVMAVYTTRIEADAAEAPVLLGNGDPVESGTLPNGRHFAVWRDPHPKPCYLFALVGGKLGRIGGEFTTMSGRKVELGIYVEPGKEARAGYALDALIRSMRWDETAFGCEYDLDVFNIVAVSDFNMGAMENKGLNIFNDKYVLASPETATDADYAAIEAIIAHEYFHNWTGNRITCRDWFQLCLKEGLTVFRDQEFSSDERSRPVKRIADVRTLRAQQFAEDSGPLAHPVRPSAYREINNFYTATVYEKGAEVIRMLKALLGATTFKAGMDLYLQRCDGAAATIEDFLACFAQASGRDLSQFSLWYRQAGTPSVAVRTAYDAAARTLRLDFAQSTPPTPGQNDKEPVVIPIRLGVVSPQGEVSPLRTVTGETLDDGLFVLERTADSLTLADIPPHSVPSLLRGFSAPVRLEQELQPEDLLTLFSRDADPFNRWQAAQRYAMRLMVRAVEALRSQSAPVFDVAFAQALGELLLGVDDHAFAAQVMALPSEADVARELGRDIDPDAVLHARKALRAFVGSQIGDTLAATYERLANKGPYSPDAASAGRRALRNATLDLLAAGDPARGIPLAQAQFAAADNMTDQIGALAILAQHPGDAREDALEAFGARFAGDPLVLDKWFGLQAAIPEAATLDRVRRLMSHPAFSLANPNRARALVGAFAMANMSQFHRADGAGYAFLADIVLQLDGANPQLAARLLGAFRTWRSLEHTRRAKAETELRRIAARPDLSPDVSDIVTRSLA